MECEFVVAMMLKIAYPMRFLTCQRAVIEFWRMGIVSAHCYITYYPWNDHLSYLALLCLRQQKSSIA